MAELALFLLGVLVGVVLVSFLNVAIAMAEGGNEKD